MSALHGDLEKEVAQHVVRATSTGSEHLHRSWDMFVSYRRSDGLSFARSVHQAMQLRGVCPFLDKCDLPGGRHHAIPPTSYVPYPVCIPACVRACVRACMCVCVRAVRACHPLVLYPSIISTHDRLRFDDALLVGIRNAPVFVPLITPDYLSQRFTGVSNTYPT